MNNVFGLDIGTRNIVGTVGYRTEQGGFTVIAQSIREHQTRAMLDGQIHDIGRVAKMVSLVKEDLEDQIGIPLEEVCIAAAGRVLKTITTYVEYQYPEESVVTGEDINTLHLLGVEQAQEILKEKNDTAYKFYCVGYSVVRYYLNGENFISIEGHKARSIGCDIIVTFLPEDVVDGLYSAVGQAGLEVANMTLEPIAAINVAIPENFRMLNIALVDVGAGTSDISVTKDGSIIAYGMIPHAGDELTELIVQHYLVDFNTAERMKRDSGELDMIEYEDIMFLPNTVSAQEIWDLLAPTVENIATEVAEKIKELNGGKSVSACFVVGGGGKIHGFTELLAEKLGLIKERVALRGQEVLRQVEFIQTDIKKDPLLVTPIGICLNYYEQKNNFIMVRFNGERLKLYDNNHLTIVDAALMAGYPNEQIFPKRGKSINFTINGTARIIRGEAGEAAVVTLNGEPANINTPLEPNCDIRIKASTRGEDAVYKISMLEEYKQSNVTFIVNGKFVTCPKFVIVNGKLVPGSYEIQDGDSVETRSFYTVAQVAEFMDVEVDTDKEILVNNRSADFDTLVYENFTIEWTPVSFGATDEREVPQIETLQADEEQISIKQVQERQKEGTRSERYFNKWKFSEHTRHTDEISKAENTNITKNTSIKTEALLGKNTNLKSNSGMETDILVYVNKAPVVLTGKDSYIFVDIFDFISFDLNAGNGRAIETLINGRKAQFTEPLFSGDKIELFWKEN